MSVSEFANDRRGRVDRADAGAVTDAGESARPSPTLRRFMRDQYVEHLLAQIESLGVPLGRAHGVGSSKSERSALGVDAIERLSRGLVEGWRQPPFEVFD